LWGTANPTATLFGRSDGALLINSQQASGSVVLTAGTLSKLTMGSGAAAWLQNYSSSAVGLMIYGASGQTAALQQWRNSAGTVLASVDSAGALHSPGVPLLNQPNTWTTGAQTFQTGGVGATAMIIQGATGQTAPLLDIHVDSTRKAHRPAEPSRVPAMADWNNPACRDTNSDRRTSGAASLP
jgi:hypothetical protein